MRLPVWEQYIVFLPVGGFQSVTSISRPSSLGRKRGHTFYDTVITEAASRVPISRASAMVLP